ncbi:MAG: class A beta-lactamase [Gammaproteobacteria bacterium]|nr:class A beta-lactamase [Gammaproteobacteria bacterium]
MGVAVFVQAGQVEMTSVHKKLAALEASSGGRLGICAINTTNNQRIDYRAEERFQIQSTFKVMAVAAVLKQSMTDNKLLQEKVNYTKHDLVFWSPVTEKHLNEGMTIAQLCSAALSYSDNTATNLIMKKQGGPQAVTAFARSIGDSTFRIDGWEPALNSNPADARDSSTPAAMKESLQKLAFGKILGPSQRELFIAWMKANTTGDTRIRAGVPKGWTVADKTGTGEYYGISNDIGIIWPPGCAPLILAIYSRQDKPDGKRQDLLIASATRLLIDEFAKREDGCVPA